MKTVNDVRIEGEVVNVFHNKVRNVTCGLISIYRTSGAEDVIPFESEFNDNIHLEHAVIIGKLETRNLRDPAGKNHKQMFVRVQSYDKAILNDYYNAVEFEGILVKKDKLRETPRGKTIMDVVFAINDESGISYYPSAIAWENIARRVEETPIGTKFIVHGRFQSREYQKQIGDEIVKKDAYEISISSLESL